MPVVRWLILLCSVLFLPKNALADSCYPAATEGPYSLDLCLSPSSMVLETGPHGTETFLIENALLGWDNPSLALNNHGDWALVTDGGTNDPSTMYGHYAGVAITVPPIELTNASSGCHPSGPQPGQTLPGDDGNLGYNIPQALGIRFNCYAFPTITGISEQGEVSASVFYEDVDGSLKGTFNYTWDFKPVPEPATLGLTIVGLLLIAFFHWKSVGAKNRAGESMSDPGA